MDDVQRRIDALEGKIAQLKSQPTSVQTKRNIEWYDAEQFDQTMRCLPRLKYLNIVKRQQTAITNIVNTHGFPAELATVDVQEILIWFHGYLGKYGKRCNGRADGPDEAKAELASRKEILDLQAIELKVQMLQADLEKKAGNSIAAAEVDQLFAWFESELRKLGERLGKRFGADAQELFNNTLDRIGKHLENLLPNDEGAV